MPAAAVVAGFAAAANFAGTAAVAAAADAAAAAAVAAAADAAAAAAPRSLCTGPPGETVKWPHPTEPALQHLPEPPPPRPEGPHLFQPTV